MSTQNNDTPPVTPNVTPPPKAKEPLFDNPEDNVKVVEEETRIHKAGEKAQEQLHSLEDKFVSLSSQRQLNFILGSLLLIAAFTAGLGVLITLILGSLMIFQALSGNMVFNNFFDTMDQKHKKWLIPGLIGLLTVIFIAYVIIGLIGIGGES